MANPFAKPTAPAAPVAHETAAPEKEKKVRAKKEGPRKVPAPQLTADQRKFIIANYASMETSQIAHELTKESGKEVTRQQVYRTVLDTRLSLQKRLDAATAAGDKAAIKKIQELLTSLPKKEFGGGGGGKRGSAVDSMLDDLLG